MTANTYLADEKIGKLLRQFAIPCIFSLVISCLYNIVDQIFVGNGIGYLGNAATGVIFPITVVGWGLSLFFGDGAAAALSMAAGRNETKIIPKCVASAISCSLISGAALITISYCLGDGLLMRIGATEANIDMARDYGRIIFAMTPLALVQNSLAAIIRADGSPRYAMGAMLAGAVINIIGDPLAIFVFDMGIKGAAYATILGQFVSFVICAAYLAKGKTFKLTFSSFKPDFALLKRIMALGASSLFTQLSIVIVTVVNNVLLVKYGAQSIYGADIPLAAFVVIMKLFQITLNIAIGIAAGAQPIAGYNYGAKLYDRVKELLSLIIKWTIAICLICTALFEAAPKFFISLFGSDGGLYSQFAVRCLRVYLSLVLFTCLQKTCAIFLQSIGHAKASAPLSMLRDVLLIVFSLIAPALFGVTGIFWAAPLADVIAMGVTAVVMIRLWKELCANGGEAKSAAGSAGAILQSTRAGAIITISREHGSAGKRIGMIAAKRLGVPCYYKETAAFAARESGLAEEFISAVNSDKNAVMKEVYLASDAVQSAITAQVKAIREIAGAGACVIVGRASNYALRDYKNAVSVFIYAPKAYRAKKIMETYGDTEEEAFKSIAKSDSARAAYYKSVSGEEWSDPHNYNLCIDASIGEENAAGILCDYVKRMHNDSLDAQP